MKRLRCNPNWVDCKTRGCDFGWIWYQTDKTKKKRLHCKACNKTQDIERKEIDSPLEKLQRENLPQFIQWLEQKGIEYFQIVDINLKVL